MMGPNFEQLTSRLRHLEHENQHLRSILNSNRHSDSPQKHSGIDFEAKYKKALKEIYEVIQANKQLKEQLDKLKDSRSHHESNMSNVRKDQIHRGYDSVLRQKNQLASINQDLELERERLQYQIQSLEAEVSLVKNEKMEIAQQKEALESSSYGHRSSHKRSSNDQSEVVNNLSQKLNQKEEEIHRMVDQFEHQEANLSKQNKRYEERVQELEEKVMSTQKTWRERFEEKDIEQKEQKTSLRHEYQEQINNLRKQINSLKELNNELMTKLQTSEFGYRNKDGGNEYEVEMLSSLKQLRLQMEPMKRQIVELQEMNMFESEQTQREKTALTMRLYEMEGDVERYQMVVKSQEEKILKLSSDLQSMKNNEQIVKRLTEENRILGGRVIVLESKDLAVEGRDGPATTLDENVVEFRTRIEMLLNDKENVANLKNVSVHQLLSLKAYIVEMDQKLKRAGGENEYALRKYRSYKEKYLRAVREMKQHEVLENTLKTKILGYDKLVHRLQAELEKSVNLSEMEIINAHSKTTQELSQVQVFKRKYDGLKEKLILQERYNKQELETIRLDYESRLMEVSIQAQESHGLRQTVSLYREKNEEIMGKLSQKENELLDMRLTVGRHSALETENSLEHQQQYKDIISSLQDTIHKQEAIEVKLHSELKAQEDANRKRIASLERQIQEANSELSKAKLSAVAKDTNQKALDDLTSENKRLRTKILELENEIVMVKNHRADEGKEGLHEMELRISSVELEKTQLEHRLQSEVSNKKRLEKQVQELNSRANQLDSEITQLNLQNGRKVQELKREIEDQKATIEGLAAESKELKNIRKSSNLLEVSTHSVIPPKQDNSLYEGRIQSLERQLKDLEADNEQYRSKLNAMSNSNNTIQFEMESLRHDKEESLLKVARLEKELISVKQQAANEEELTEKNRAISQLRAELTESRRRLEDELFERERLIAQLKSRVESQEHSANAIMVMEAEFADQIAQKDREMQRDKSELKRRNQEIEELNETARQLHDTINRYNQDIISLKNHNEAASNSYAKHMEETLGEKEKLLAKFREQNGHLNSELTQKNEELSIKEQSLTRLQRELKECQEYEEEVERLKRSLGDRETAVSKSKFDLFNLEEENERFKKENLKMKEELQRLKFDMIEKDDELSKTRLQINSVSMKISNQLQSEYSQQIMDRDGELSRVGSQLQSLRNNYETLESEFNDSQQKERRLRSEVSIANKEIARLQEELSNLNEKFYRREQQLSRTNSELTSMKFLEEELTEKTTAINKLKSELTTLQIENSHLSEEAAYKDNARAKANAELNYIRQQVAEKEEELSGKDEAIRRLNQELMSAKSHLEESTFTIDEKETAISRLTSEVNKLRKENREMEEEMEEREQQVSSMNQEINQIKGRISLTADELDGRDMTIAKLQQEAAFFKQEIVRMNEEAVQKNHQAHQLNQELFSLRLAHSDELNLKSEGFSKRINALEMQLEALSHEKEDIEAQNRRLKIELDGSRLKFNEQSSLYIYTEEDMQTLRDEANQNYKKIMSLQHEISHREEDVRFLNERTLSLERQLKSAEGSNEEDLLRMRSEIDQLQEQIRKVHLNSEEDMNRMQNEIEGFIMKEREYVSKIQQLETIVTQHQTNTERSNSDMKSNEELKYGLHLYTEETDRLHKIIHELTEEVEFLRAKMSTMSNQEQRMEENLVTMVMTFAEIESLRERMKHKETEINEVRRSLIQVASSNEDVYSQRGQSSKYFKSMHEADSKVIMEEPGSENLVSITKLDVDEVLKDAQEAVREANEVVKQSAEYVVQQQNEVQEQNLDIQSIERDRESDVDELNRMKESEDGQQTPQERESSPVEPQTPVAELETPELVDQKQTKNLEKSQSGAIEQQHGLLSRHVEEQSQSQQQLSATQQRRATISISYQHQQRHEVSPESVKAEYRIPPYTRFTEPEQSRPQVSQSFGVSQAPQILPQQIVPSRQSFNGNVQQSVHPHPVAFQQGPNSHFQGQTQSFISGSSHHSQIQRSSYQSVGHTIQIGSQGIRINGSGARMPTVALSGNVSPRR